jgi:hypothetical protein
MMSRKFEGLSAKQWARIADGRLEANQEAREEIADLKAERAHLRNELDECLEQPMPEPVTPWVLRRGDSIRFDHTPDGSGHHIELRIQDLWWTLERGWWIEAEPLSNPPTWWVAVP